MIKITLPLVDELQRERGIVVPRQIDGASKQQLHQIKGGSKLNQSHRNTTDRGEKEGQKTGAQSQPAVSTGVIKTNSLELGEERVKEKGTTDSPF